MKPSIPSGALVAAVACLVACGAQPSTAGREPSGRRAGPAAAAAGDGAAARQLTAWLAAFNSGEREVLRAYLEASAPKLAGALDLLVSLRHATGGFDLKKSESEAQAKVVVVLRERRSEKFFRATIQVEDAGLHRIVGIDLAPIAPPDELLSEAERRGATLDAARRAALIDGIARELLARYVSLDEARRMSAALRDHAARGDYDALLRGWDFARRVTDDLRAVSHDLHLSLEFGRPPAEPTRGERLAWLRSIDFGFGAIERMEGNVARLAIDQLPPLEDDEAREAVGQRMSRVADADALLLDLRQNRGGSIDAVALLASYLFDATPVHLNDLVRREDGSTKESWTLRDVRGARFGGKKPVYVIVGKETFSGGEELAYDLQCLRRAKVVGETTRGGAHAGTEHALDEWFRIDVPSQEARNPITRTNWEGVGVVPDIAAPARSALTEALHRALADLSAAR